MANGYQPWENAPQFTNIAASQQGGTRGAQFWGIQIDNQLNTIYQVTPGGAWSGWLGNNWAGTVGPPLVFDITAAQQNDGRVQLWALDIKQQLWTVWQTSPGGDWSQWSGPNWNSAQQLMEVVACQQGGSRGAQLWAITQNYDLVTCYQETPGGGWSGWQTWTATPPNSQFVQLAAAQQNDGRVQIWAIDTYLQLWSCWQTSPGGNWTGWSGPNWDSAPKLFGIAASQQGGSRGAQLWGVTQDYMLISDYQVSPGGGWSGWSSGNWANAPNVTEVAAAQQNNGCVQLWAITSDGVLISIAQTSPGGNWGSWS
jgi:hypothetical protein